MAKKLLGLRLWVGLMCIAAIGAALACGERVVERTVQVPVERTVVVERTVPVQQTVVVERTVPVERTVVVERTVQVVITPTPRPATPTPQPTPTPVPQPKVWRIGILDDVTTTNIWSILGPDSTAWNFYTQLNQYPFLYGLSDARFDWVPAWADGFPTDFVQEGELWTTTVKVRKDAKWSDGQPITARDVVFTINTVLEFQLPGNWASDIDAEIIDRVEALDDSTVKYYFKSKPGLARWQYGLSGVIFVARHFWEPLVNQAKQAATLEERQRALYAIVPENEPKAAEMTSVRWERGAFFEARANPNYYFANSKVTEYANGAYKEEKPGVYSFTAYGEPTGDVSLEFTRGPYAQSVIYSVYASQDAAVLALERGEIDYLATPLGLQQGFQRRLAGNPNLRVLANAPNGIRYLGFNTRKPPQNIKAFRQAVAVLIDKEFITSTVLQGVAQPAYTMVPPGNGAWYNPDVPKLGTDPATGRPMTREQRINEAVRLLKSAGFTWDEEPRWDPDSRVVVSGRGLKMPDGTPVPQIELLSPSAGYDPLRATFAIWIERWLNEAGIPVKANLTGFNLIATRVFDEQDFDMWILGWGLTVFPDYLRDFFHSTRAEKGDLNAGGYSNPEFDTLSDTLVTTTDLDEAKENAFRLQEILAEESPYVVLFTTQILEPVSNSVKFPFTTVMDGFQNYLQSANGPLAYASFE